jgi:hypothetical protein
MEKAIKARLPRKVFFSKPLQRNRSVFASFERTADRQEKLIVLRSEAACGRAGLSPSIFNFHSIKGLFLPSVLHYAFILVSLPALEAAAEIYSRPTAELYPAHIRTK